MTIGQFFVSMIFGSIVYGAGFYRGYTRGWADFKADFKSYFDPE